MRSDSREKRGREKGSDAAATASLGVTLMGVGLGGKAAAHLLRLSASRAAELDADAAAADAFGAASMISALKKIDAGGKADSQLRSGLAGAAMAHAMISDGEQARGRGLVERFSRMLRTHPSLQDRVAALRALEERKAL